MLTYEGHHVAVTQGDAAIFAERSSRAEVSFTDEVVLNGAGAAAVVWPAS